jgi:hypothetical protein
VPWAQRDTSTSQTDSKSESVYSAQDDKVVGEAKIVGEDKVVGEDVQHFSSFVCSCLAKT